MRIKVIACVVFLFIGLFTLQRLHSAVGALQRLGVSDEIARECIELNFTGTSWEIPNKSALKGIVTGERASLVRELARYVKTYSQTEEFRKAWLDYREGRKPSPPERLDSLPEMKRKQKESLESAIRETEKNMASMPQEMRAGVREVVASLKQQLAEIDDPENPMFSPQMAENMKQVQGDQNRRHRARLEEWEKDYPLTPEKAIREKLEVFLKESENIDFNAALVRQPDGVMRFKNAENERMSDIRKMCFRAGKDAVNEARSFSQEWLKELAGSTP